MSIQDIITKPKSKEPCSARGRDGSLCPFCPFCDQYKEMQFMEFIAVINNSFKDGSLSEDVYNDLFDTFCQIIIGGSSMPVMPLMTKLLFYLPSVSVELFQNLVHLIEKFEKFFRKMECRPRPDFLSTPNLRSFTEAELKHGQDQFQKDIPKFGFCCCDENIEKYGEAIKRRHENERERMLQKVADEAVQRYKKTIAGGW